MSILADRIEKFILTKLLEEQDPLVILQRKELADELACAPSQISYVLSTRFSNDKGFIVESRRGLGGFIRIMRIPDESEGQTPQRSAQSEPVTTAVARRYKINSISEADEMLFRLVKHQLITRREAAFLHAAFAQIFFDVELDRRMEAVNQFYNQILTLLREE